MSEEKIFNVSENKGVLKVKIKDLWCSTFKDTPPNFKSWFYGWNRLEKSITNNGYNPEKYSHIVVNDYNKNGCKYIVKNGNHRVKMLEKLYGKDFELEVKHQGHLQPFSLKNMFKNLIFKKDMLNKISNIIGFLLMFWYFFIVNFLATILVAVVIWFVLQYFPASEYNKAVFYTPPEDKKKWFDKYPKLYTMYLNMSNNMRIILLGLILMGYCIHLMSNSFIEFCIVMLILIIINLSTFRKLM